MNALDDRIAALGVEINLLIVETQSAVKGLARAAAEAAGDEKFWGKMRSAIIFMDDKRSELERIRVRRDELIRLRVLVRCEESNENSKVRG